MRKKFTPGKRYAILALSAVMLAGCANSSGTKTTQAETTVSETTESQTEASGVQADGIVKTTAGLIQGTKEDGIYCYLGVPYAEAKERFVPAEEVTPWEGVRVADTYGPMSPQAQISGVDGESSQNGTDNNSQNLNIWTPGVNDGKKRPVMVWLHGGGFSTGSANEEGYDGQALSSSGDVVIVSVNHRLNVFGYLDLSAYGDKYKYSANVGLMDIVDSLKWIQDNIEAFGGDPENVTLFGQSGGGSESPGDDDISVCERFIPEGNRPERRDRDHGSKIQHPGVQHGSCGEHLKESKYHTGQYRGYPVRVRG